MNRTVRNRPDKMENHMKMKTFLCGALTAGLLAGFASEQSEQTKQAELETRAKIARADAQQTALQQVPNGTIKESEIEKEHGRLIWSFDIAVPDSKNIKEIAVDAMNGEVVSVETETAEQEAREKD